MADERDRSGEVLAGRYRLLHKIGGGGMGSVYAGEHIEVGRKVAIKILLPEASARPARLPQTIGSFAAIWDDILPPLPDDVWRANLATVAAAMDADPS